MKRFFKKLFIIGIYAAVLSSSPLFAQLQVKSYVDKNIIENGDQFTLFVEISGKDSQKSGQPDLPDLSAFAAFLGSGSSRSVQIINGKMSVTKTLQYQYQAIKEGKFTINPVQVKAGGKTYSTGSINIEIVKSSGSTQRPQNRSRSNSSMISSKDLYLRVIPNKHKVYVNEPLVLTYKIYTRVDVTSFGFQKLPETTGFWVEDFTKNASRPVTKTEVINGVRYTVATIKEMALFPMSAGDKVLEPMVIVCSVRVKRRSNDIFDSFFDDPFGRQINKSIASKPMKISVKPLPQQQKPADFSGIVGNYVISASVDKNYVSTNEAVTFKFIVKGSGNLKTLPEPKIKFSDDFEVYPPKVTQNVSFTSGIVHGTKTFEYVLIPRKPGIKKLPAVKLSVFNPAKNKYELISTKQIVLNVKKSSKKFESTAHTGLTKEEVMLVDKDIRFIKTECSRFYPAKPEPVFSNLWFLILMLFPVLSIISAVIYRRHTDKMMTDQAYARNKRSSKMAKKRLADARKVMDEERGKEFYAEAGKALIGFVADKLNIPEAGLITKDVKEKLKGLGVSEKTINEYFECVNICDIKRFSPETSTHDEMKSFIKRAEDAIDLLNREM